MTSELYINELLMLASYALLINNRAKAKQLSYKYIWVKAGTIGGRRTDGCPVIFINSVADLAILV